MFRKNTPSNGMLPRRNEHGSCFFRSNGNFPFKAALLHFAGVCAATRVRMCEVKIMGSAVARGSGRKNFRREEKEQRSRFG